MLKAVVTGGAGFIGSHICDLLSQKGYHVTILDDLSSGKKANIAHLLGRPGVEFIQGSITDIALLQRCFQSADYVFHQAAIPSVPRSIANPLATNEVNINGTLNVLVAARDNAVKKVVYASSSSVYGDTPTLPKKEDMPANPLSPYAVSKLAAEHYCLVFNLVYHLPTVCLRYFNVFGPRQDPDSQYAAVIPKFIKNIREGLPPVIFGDGEQTRDFTFVKDVARANVMAAETDAGGVYNIGGGRRTSLNQLARLILKELGREEMSPRYEEARPGDIRHSLADISRAKSFGYTPQFSLEDGLREMLKI